MMTINLIFLFTVCTCISSFTLRPTIPRTFTLRPTIPRTFNLRLRSTLVPNILTVDSPGGRNIITNPAHSPESTIFFDAFFPTSEDGKLVTTETIVYLPCLSRPKNNAKSSNLENFSKCSIRNFIVADYFGVGRSSGEFVDATVSRWRDDAIHLIEHIKSVKKSGIANDGVVIVGAGVGGWVALLVARLR